MKSTPRFTPREQHSPILGYVLTILSSLSTACVVILGKWVMTSGDPIFRGGLVVFFAGIILLAGSLLKDGVKLYSAFSSKALKYTLLYTLFSIAALSGFWAGLSMVEASKVGFIGRLQILVIVLLGVIFLKERFRPFEIFAGMIILGGIYVLHSTFPKHISLGFWILLFSAFSFGVVEILAKVTVRYCEPYKFNTVRNLIAGLALIIMAFIKGNPDLQLGKIWIGVIAMSFLGPVIGRVFYLYALKYTEVTKASLVSQIQPVFVVILGIVFLDEFPETMELLGGGLVIIGCAAIIFSHPKPGTRLFKFHKHFQ